MSKLWKRSALVALALSFPVGAFADLTGTATLSAGQGLKLDTGATTTSGDIIFTGTSITFVGSAKGGALPGITGATFYNSLDQSTLQSLTVFATTTPIPANSFPIGAIIGVLTNAGHAAKLLVTAVSSTSLSFQYTTYGATGSGGGPSAPTITSILNNYGLIPAGLPNYGIAPGAVFILKGTGLASIPIASATLQSSASPGIPKTLNGASISVTVNGTTVTPGIYYAGDTQVAAVLPSSTPVGTGTVTLTYNGVASSPAPFTVVASALGLDTYYGAGLGVATDPSTGALFNYTNSAVPGKSIVLWGSGLGADTADSDTVFTSTPHAVSSPLTIYIGGVQAQVLYAGSSGYPGVNQINVTIPASAPTGCGVSIVAVSGSIVSNTITLPIKAGGGTCSDPLLGIDGSQLTTLIGKTNYNSGSLFILQSTGAGQVSNFATGVFQNVQTTSSSNVSGLTSVGSCIVSTSITGSGGPTITSTGLDAGTITVTGPTGPQTLTAFTQVPGTYLAQLAAGFIPATGGTFTFQGTGGANVGAFNVSVNYTSPLVWTNSSSITSVARATGVNVTWTGGASGSYVIISGSSSSGSASAGFVCYAPASALSFTVPSYVLLALPTGSGSLSLENITNPVSFSASGLDFATAFAGAAFSISPTYQ